MVFLPERALPKNLENFVPGKYTVIFLGLIECNKSNPAANFEINEIVQYVEEKIILGNIEKPEGKVIFQ